jgi:hypothetical protein
MGLVKTSLMVTLEALAAGIRVVRQWARRAGMTSDPLWAPMAEDGGFEELDAGGQTSLAGPLTLTIHLTASPRRREFPFNWKRGTSHACGPFRLPRLPG